MNTHLHKAAQLSEYTQALRRDFHRHPELGFQEVRTAGIVARELNALGLEVSTGIAETGVVALIEGAKPGPVLLLRFDMDALPIVEETGAEYASQTHGVMHACGHDGHTAVGLTVARMLHEQREDLPGTIKLVFQPAEEGLGGAERMIREGVLENPKPDYTLSLHLWNDKPVGWIGVTSGPAMAAAEKFKARIIGKGGHGAAPHQTLDPVAASAQVINSLQNIVSRNISPMHTAVVSVTMVHGGEAFNVIPSEVTIEGTIRTFEPEARAIVVERFCQIVEGISNTCGCRAEIEFEALTPAVINDPQITARVQNAIAQAFPDRELDMNNRTMGSEDMAFMMREVPGCYFFVGSSNADLGLNAAHHHPRFDFDERALPLAAALMSTSAVELLSG